MLELLLELPIRRELELLLIMNLEIGLGLLLGLLKEKNLEELLGLLLGLLLLMLPHKIIFFMSIFLSR